MKFLHSSPLYTAFYIQLFDNGIRVVLFRLQLSYQICNNRIYTTVQNALLVQGNIEPDMDLVEGMKCRERDQKGQVVNVTCSCFVYISEKHY